MPDADQTSLKLQRFTPYRLNRLAATVSDSLAQVYAERFSLTREEWRILANLAELGRARTVDIIAATSLEKMQVSRASARLEGRGLITRSICDEDRRSQVLGITPAGRRLYGQIAPIVLAREAFLLESLNDDERATLDRVLDKLQSRAEQLRRQG